MDPGSEEVREQVACEPEEDDEEEEEERRGQNAPKNFAGFLKDDEKWLVCPYDKSHRSLRNQFTHLINCRKAYEDKKKANNEEMDIDICPYNWKHHVPISEMEAHTDTCEDQYLVATYLRYYDIRKNAEKMLSRIKYTSQDSSNF
ncbi:unnamed protein product [Orchesella dallaii]|uniref:CHHC U11-48K-type domain-containing protein n=1 Tax=Orchesella dallaii TaxID=48710 RepID=A0ABP1PRD3_9HEXA